MRFLLIAASRRSAATLFHFCSALNILVDVVGDAEAAMAKLQQRQSYCQSASAYDLLIVDLDGLGGMGGYAFSSWYRQQHATSPTHNHYHRHPSASANSELATPTPAAACRDRHAERGA